MRRSLKSLVALSYCRRMTFLMAISVGLAIAQAPATSYTLGMNWERDLGPVNVNDSAFYRLAACPDGIVYLTDSLGRVAILDSAGTVLSDTRSYPELTGSVAVFCDERGRLFSASGRLLVTLERKDSHLELASAIPYRRGNPWPHRLVVAEDGSMFIVGSVDGNSFVHALDAQGNVRVSFGEAPIQSPAKLGKYAAARGSLVWNTWKKQLVFLPMNPFELSVYDPRGNLLAKNQETDSEFKRMRYDVQRDAPLTGDEVTYAAYLPTGELVVQTLKLAKTASGRTYRKNYLNIFDSNLRLVQTFPIDSKFGVLQGVATDGALYFARITRPTGIHVVSARLIPAQP